MLWMLYFQFVEWEKNPLICKSDMATDNKILATLYSEASMTTDNFNNKFLVLWSGAIPEVRKKRILVEKSFLFGDLKMMKK